MQSLIETLPLPQRLAFAYAPAGLRSATLALLAFDAHLAGLVRHAREPLLGQMRLAWWRERLLEPVTNRPGGDPVLDLLRTWESHEHALVRLVDGWENLLGGHLYNDAIDAFAGARALAFAGLAEVAGLAEFAAPAAHAAKRWALADLAAHLGDADERQRALAAAAELGSNNAGLPRSLRPLAVLDGLARRSLARGGAPLADGPRAGLAALRLGLFGR